MELKKTMNSRERVYAVLEGRTPDCFPVFSPYTYLALADHWKELTGRPVVDYYRWLIADPEEHARVFRQIHESWPFDMIIPTDTLHREIRQDLEVVMKDGKAYYHHKRNDSHTLLAENVHEQHGAPNEERLLLDMEDVRNKVHIRKAEDYIQSGQTDFIKQIVKEMGQEKFIISGGLINTFYACSYYVGLTNLFSLLYDEPEFIHYLSERLLEGNLERVRAYAACGGDAVVIDDATATCDMVSPRTYEEFSMPYLKRTIDEIHRHGMKAIVIYFGGIADRVEQIISTGADILSMESSMKAYSNDYDDIASKAKGRIAICGNLNPYDDIEITSDAELEERIRKQAEAGRKYGKYISSTGSPLTPHTSSARIRKFIDLAHRL